MPPVMTPTAALLTRRQAAGWLTISERKLLDLTAPKGPIPVLRDGRWVRYDPRDLDRYVQAAKCRQAVPATCDPSTTTGA
ncbi:helix-turn-helix domain-containing protein [Alienimonas chondri]|uniref:DNA-binding protein n=1 Tax=Alienimonas chondri TaxID=2681879 RepID=A0ABX1V8A6_9PLAN|nr:helix-turn-helix domain-containing protein [Alienimonas chondri]NNJ24093.1 hypothetical protein [Alienimonas chondri]